jgi:hypothetical protein
MRDRKSSLPASAQPCSRSNWLPTKTQSALIERRSGDILSFDDAITNNIVDAAGVF